MILPRTTVCTLFSINSPMWQGSQKKRVVGLALNRIGLHNAIEFNYIRKSDGKKSIEGQYYISRDKIANLDFERQNRKGLTLVLVPFSELEVLTRELDVKPSLEPEMIPQSRLQEIHDMFLPEPITQEAML